VRVASIRVAVGQDEARFEGAGANTRPAKHGRAAGEFGGVGRLASSKLRTASQRKKPEHGRLMGAPLIAPKFPLAAARGCLRRDAGYCVGARRCRFA